jgi:hypothetical protein
LFGEFGGFDEYGFVGGECGERVAGADYDFNDGAFHEAEELSATDSLHSIE